MEGKKREGEERGKSISQAKILATALIPNITLAQSHYITLTGFILSLSIKCTYAHYK